MFYCLILSPWWNYYPICPKKEEAGRNHWDNSPSQRVDCPLWYGCVPTQWWRPIVISVGRGFKAAMVLFSAVSIISLSVVLKAWRFFGEDTGTAAYYYHPDKILFSYIYHKHFIAQLLSLLLTCIYHQSWEQKANSLFSTWTYAADCLDFSSYHLS